MKWVCKWRPQVLGDDYVLMTNVVVACVALTPEFICTDGGKASIPLHNPGTLTGDKVKPLLGKIYIYK